jgi:hypothetical protein
VNIRIDPHTLIRAKERGADETEIKDVILTGDPIPAKSGRLGKAKVYSFGMLRNGKRYAEKRIEVFYVSDHGTFVTVTVYVFYGKWR